MPTESNAAKAYASFADRYDARAPSKAHNALYERPATHALLGDVAGLSVLDAGCGSGIGTELLARHGATVTGFDPKTLPALAKEQYTVLPEKLKTTVKAKLDEIRATSLPALVISSTASGSPRTS